MLPTLRSWRNQLQQRDNDRALRDAVAMELSHRFAPGAADGGAAPTAVKNVPATLFAVEAQRQVRVGVGAGNGDERRKPGQPARLMQACHGRIVSGGRF